MVEISIVVGRLLKLWQHLSPFHSLIAIQPLHFSSVSDCVFIFFHCFEYKSLVIKNVFDEDRFCKNFVSLDIYFLNLVFMQSILKVTVQTSFRYLSTISFTS